MATTRRIVSLATAVSLTACLVGSAHAEPLRLRYAAVWVGFGPLFVAQEKGFFDQEGIEVELIRIDDHTAALAALHAGQVDAVATAAQDSVVLGEPGEEPLACVLALTDSRGADGVLARTDIRSIADLKGRTVAYGRHGLSQFYVNVLLKEAGLSEVDIEDVDLFAEEATTAFMLGEVDAAVTWEPYLTQGKNVDHGHLLTDSSERPGLLGDCLAAKASLFNDRKEEFQAVARAWDAGVHFVEAHPDEANEIMARNLGDWLRDPVVFADMLRGVAFYDLNCLLNLLVLRMGWVHAAGKGGDRWHRRRARSRPRMRMRSWRIGA